MENELNELKKQVENLTKITEELNETNKLLVQTIDGLIDKMSN